MIFIHTMHCWKQKLIEELEMELAELIAMSGWLKTGYPYGLQSLHCVEKRSDTPSYFLNNHNIGQTKELENAPVLLSRNTIIHIIHKQNKTQAAGKTATAASTATNATSNMSNTSLTSYFVQFNDIFFD